jgi:N-methylhydantoinase B/oxoprolinase/acetone carboxylase alpha subunit
MDARVREVNLDPVTLEVIRNALPAISTEMAADLQRTSYNMMLRLHQLEQITLRRRRL